MTHFDRVIPPGQEGKVTAKINTKNLRGNASKSVRVTTNDPKMASVTLLLKANVTPLIDVQPSEQVAFRTIHRGEPTSQELKITGKKGRPLKLSDVTSSVDFVKAKLSEPDKEGTYTLKVELAEDAPLGNISNGRITVKTNYTERPDLFLRVTGRVFGPINFSPENVFFSGFSKERPATLTKRVNLQATKEETFEILEVSTSLPEMLKVESQALVEGKRYQISLQYIGDFDRQSFHGKLNIKTNMEEQPIIEIPVSGRALSSGPRVRKPNDGPSKPAAKGEPTPSGFGREALTQKQVSVDPRIPEWLVPGSDKGPKRGQVVRVEQESKNLNGFECQSYEPKANPLTLSFIDNHHVIYYGGTGKITNTRTGEQVVLPLP